MRPQPRPLHHYIASQVALFPLRFFFNMMSWNWYISFHIQKIMMGYYFLDLRNQVLKGQKYKFCFSQHFVI